MKRLARPTYRRPPETIVALVDVVFFLLVFALLIGRMDATAPFNVAPPMALTGADLPSGGTTISIGSDGALALDGTTTSSDTLLATIERQLRADRALRVRINADGATLLRHVLPLVDQLKALGASDVVLIVTPDTL